MKKILFAVCTEGSGHTIQAIATKQFLNKNGYDASCILAAEKKVGLPKFFTDEFNVVTFEGFDFVFDNHGKVVLWKTMLKNVIELPRLIYAFIKICKTIKQENPDTIVNFYEPLVGLSALLFPKINYISISHQNAMTLDAYPKINGYAIQKFFLKLINCVTTIRAKKVALSYYEFNDDNVICCPPVLRQSSYDKSDKTEDFVLIYLMNQDLVPGLIEEAIKYPDIKLECFTRLTRNFECPHNLKLHKLDGKLFQEKMKVCKAVICSGGFETTAEAILNNKPVLMVPLPNHYEQYANCNDAEQHGLATYSTKIQLNKIPTAPSNNTDWFYTVESKLKSIFNI